MTRLPDPTYDPAFYEGVLPKRFFAWVIDAALMFVVMVILSVFSVGIFFLLWIPVHATLAFLYRWSMLRQSSATLGMRVMNIELRGPAGARLTSNEAALHTLVFLIGAVFAVVQLISIILMFSRPLNRGLADEVTGVVMLNRPS